MLRDRWCHIIVLNVYAPTEDNTYDVKDSFYEELERVFDKFSKYHMKILLEDLNAKVGKEDIFKPTIGNEGLHEIAKLKEYKSPGSDEIPAELIRAGGKTLLSAIHKPINSVRNKELLDQWKESIIVPVHKKDDKTDCNNYRGISLLSTAYNILLNILLSRFGLYIR
jgi:hypothetical protein